MTLTKYAFFFFISFLGVTANAGDYTLKTAEIPPYSSKNEASSGFILDLIEEMFKRAKLDLDVEFHPWARSQKIVIQAKQEQKLLASPLTRTPKREPHYDWIIPLYQYQLQFVTNDITIPIRSLESLKKISSICVLRETPAEYKLKSLGFTNIHNMVNEVKCMEMLNLKRVQAVLVHGRIMGNYNYRIIGSNPEELIYGYNSGTNTIYLGSTKGVMPISDKIKLEAALQSIKSDGTYDKIISRYL